MRRITLVVACFVLALAAQALPQVPARTADTPAGSAQPPKTSTRKIPCKTPENASMCYWTRGRLSFYNGVPSFRIWKIGTKRIVGVYSGPSRYPPRDNNDITLPEFPANLLRYYENAYERALKIDRSLIYPGPTFADFELCPLEPEHQGWMQAVCIQSARNMYIEPVEPRPR